ncbi:hypothetical protein cypCar_00007029, partial [Cyprinus carpio]
MQPSLFSVYTEVFWKGCLPGSQGSLCKVCMGGTEEAATKRCADNHNERYYGNMGALRCLVGDPSGKSFGDVAFMEHHNLERNIECLNTSGWAEGWLAWDFELLCGDGSRAPLTEWKTCNLGAIPPNIVMTRPVLIARIYDLLMKSQETIAARPDSGFHLFESQQYGESDLLFKDATKCLVHTSHMDYRTILGEEFYSQTESIFNCTHSNMNTIYRPIFVLKRQLTPRAELQKRFSALNLGWAAYAGAVAPDGDVFLEDEQVLNFTVPACDACGGVLKPEVTFFGDVVNRTTVNFVHNKLAESDTVLVAGSSLQ